MTDMRNLSDQEILALANAPVQKKSRDYLGSLKENFTKIAKDDVAKLVSAGSIALSLLPFGRALKGVGMLAKSPMVKRAISQAITKVMPTTLKQAGKAAAYTVGSTHVANKALQGIENPDWKDHLAAMAIGHGGTVGVSKAFAKLGKKAPKVSLEKQEELIARALENKRTDAGKHWKKHGKPQEQKLTTSKKEIDLSELYSDLQKNTEGLSEEAYQMFARSPEGSILSLFKGKSQPKVEHGTIREHLKKLERAAVREKADSPSSSPSGVALAKQRQFINKAREKAVSNPREYKNARKQYSEYAEKYKPIIEDVLQHKGNRGEIRKASLKSIKDGNYVQERILDMIKDPTEKAMYAREVISHFPSIFKDSALSLNLKLSAFPALKNLFTSRPEYQKQFFKAAKLPKTKVIGYTAAHHTKKDVKDLSDDDLMAIVHS